jgi:hypothetical protein
MHGVESQWPSGLFLASHNNTSNYVRVATCKVCLQFTTDAKRSPFAPIMRQLVVVVED